MLISRYKKFDVGGPTAPISGTNRPTNVPKKKLDINGKLTDFLPFASNVANSFRKLPTPPAPILENPVTPSYINLDNSRNDIRRLQRNANNGLDYKLGNSAVAQALKGQTLATAIEGMNSVNQNEANSNAQIGNQASFYNSYVGARNTDRQNDYNNTLLNRNLNQQRLSSDNLANFGDKVQLQSRDKSLMAMENRKIDNLPLLYQDTGVYDRNLVPASEDERYKKNGGRLIELDSFGKGGRIPTRVPSIPKAERPTTPLKKASYRLIK